MSTSVAIKNMLQKFLIDVNTTISENKTLDFKKYGLMSDDYYNTVYRYTVFPPSLYMSLVQKLLCEIRLSFLAIGSSIAE